jgi:hypothetical protein
MNLNLNLVTICAADCSTPNLAARALRLSTRRCEFGDAILFSDRSITDPHFRTIQIDSLRSKNDYSRFIQLQLPEFISTPYLLLIQWDGYVLEPKAWLPEFLDFDFIGAKWHWHKDGMTVGNGGFSLRSLKLMLAMRDKSFPYVPNVPEDDQICRRYRPRLIADFGIRFAPESIADRFSYERSMPEGPTFGFHGLFNMWRHVEDVELIAMVREFTPDLLRSVEFTQLIVQYLALRKFSVFEQLYLQLKKYYSMEDIRSQIRAFSPDPGLIEYFNNVCSRIPVTA